MKRIAFIVSILMHSSQQSWSVLKPLIGLVYLDPLGTRSGPENITFTVVVLLNLTNE